MDDKSKVCEHEWNKAGLWDGKTLEGRPTGGIMYKCTKCGSKASTMEQVKKMGGSVIEGTDVYGRPIKNSKS